MDNEIKGERDSNPSPNRDVLSAVTGTVQS